MAVCTYIFKHFYTYCTMFSVVAAILSFYSCWLVLSVTEGLVNSMFDSLVDSFGYNCGLHLEVVNKSFLYESDICSNLNRSELECRSMKICLDQCPSYGPWTPEKDMAKITPEKDIKAKKICAYTIEINTSITDLINSKQCATYMPINQNESDVTKRCIMSKVAEEKIIKRIIEQVTAPFANLFAIN